jgi:hypothetical protein
MVIIRKNVNVAEIVKAKVQKENTTAIFGRSRVTITYGELQPLPVPSPEIDPEVMKKYRSMMEVYFNMSESFMDTLSLINSWKNSGKINGKVYNELNRIISNK